MDRVSVIKKCLSMFTHDLLSNEFILRNQLEYLTNEYKKLNKDYSINKLSEETNEVKECIASVSDFLNNNIVDNEIISRNNIKNNILEFRSKLLGLFLEISDLILVISYLDSVYDTKYADTQIPFILELIKELDKKNNIEEYKVSNIVKDGLISVVTKILEYKVNELYIAKQLGNGICKEDKYNKYELIFHTLYPNKKLIEEDSYKMIRKWIFIDKFDLLISILDNVK